MKNVTLAIDEELRGSTLRFARRRKTALNAMVRTRPAAAGRRGAVVFSTEDLNHNRVTGSGRAVNPFLER